MHMKKLYVLAGLSMESYRKQTNDSSKEKVSNVLDNFLEEDSFAASMPNIKLLDNAWQGAEAYHFYLLTQRQLCDGNFFHFIYISRLISKYPLMLHFIIYIKVTLMLR